MYAGAGSVPLLQAAASWDQMAAELESAAASFDSVVSGLASATWQGHAAAAMAGVAAGYVGWLSASAGLASGVAAQTRVAATAFETAHTATVHPAAVEANRVQLATLVATNFLGQNTPAIAATEFEYIAMWAQDVAAMVTYHAGALSVASQLTPFTLPPADLAGWTTQAVGIAQTAGAAASDWGAQVGTAIGSLPLASAAQGLQMLAGPAAMAISPLMSLMSSAQGAGGAGLTGATGLAEIPGATGPYAIAPPSGAGLGASAGLGQARMVGGLSVPQTWAGSAPTAAASSALTGLSQAVPAAASADAAAAAGAGGAGMPMMPMPTGAGAASGTPAGMMARGGAAPHVVQSRPSVVPRIGV